MKAAKVGLLVTALLLAAVNLFASGPVGFYAIVDKVIFEPNEKMPERIQVWGSFAVVSYGYGSNNLPASKALAGYLYFKLPTDPSAAKAAQIEWSDLKSLAGTGQAVAFGSWGFVGRTEDFGTQSFRGYFIAQYPGGAGQIDMRVRPAYDPKAQPVSYQPNTGIVKLPEQGSHAAIVKQLKEALKGQ